MQISQSYKTFGILLFLRQMQVFLAVSLESKERCVILRGSVIRSWLWGNWQ